MKVCVVIALFGVIAVAAGEKGKRATTFRDYNRVEVTDDHERDYQNYLSVFYPNYKPDENHHERYAKFHKCRNDIMEHDADAQGYAKGFTRFCHMTAAEMSMVRNHKLGIPRAKIDAPYHPYTERDAEAARALNTIDWRTKGLVSSVKDQGQCGSCYTFAAAAALEGQWKKAHGALNNASTQQYVDCAQGYIVNEQQSWNSKANAWVVTGYTFGNEGGNGGCDGGLPEWCYAYNNMTGNAQQSWECYPYDDGTYENGTTNGCADSYGCNVGMGVKGFTYIANETVLLSAILTVGPVTIGLDADPLESYTGGIIDPSTNSSMCTTTANHAVTVVGLGTSGTKQYWIVKNSWSADWGESGYFRLRTGINACGISVSGIVYPNVA